MKYNFSTRILLSLVFLVTLSIALIVVVTYTKTRQGMMNSTINETQQLTSLMGLTIDNWMRDRQSDCENWAGQKIFQNATQDSFIGKAARKSAIAECEQIVKKNEYFDSIFIVATNGMAISGSDTNQIDKLDVNDRPYFKQVMSTGKIAVSDVVISRVSGRPIVTIASPILDNAKIVGVFVGLVDLDSLSTRFLNPIKVQRTGYLYIADTKGLTVAHPDKTKIAKVNIGDYDWGREMLSKSEGYLFYTFEGAEKIVAYKKISAVNWYVAACAPTSELLVAVKAVSKINLLVGVIALGATLVIVFFLLRSMVSPLLVTIKMLEENARQVKTGAGQITSASQSLAEGSSEQAASLEETSSSLEEMASMTKQNADSAKKASELARNARHAADTGSNDMKQMIDAMATIKASSGDIAKIIKTIDEIAFQTNILALNAAVEAARAGEAGMGFAVVADEVRNLAQRSAQAARETSDKIEGAIANTEQGVQISAKVAQGLEEIVGQIRKVDELVAEIAAASQEQSQGIDQVNTAVTQMDKVTQSNAAGAEESASAAVELNAQADALRDAMDKLLDLIEGQRSTRQDLVKASATPGKGRTEGGHKTGRATPGKAPAKIARATAPKPAAEEKDKTGSQPVKGDFKDF